MNYKILILIQFIIILILLFLFMGKGKPVGPTDHGEYRTDTVYVYKTFEEAEKPKIKEFIEKGDVAPPKEITIYETKYIPTTIEVTPDSTLLLIDQLKDSLEIAKNYLVNFPNKPKLIALELDKNNLDIALLDIQGNVKKKKYPLFLDKYDYMHTGDSLIYNKAKNPEPNLKSKIFGTTGYSVLDKNIYIGGRYQLNIKKVTLEANTQIYLSNQPELFLQVGAALRLR